MNSLEFIQYMAKNITPKLAFNENVDMAQWREEAYSKLEELLGLPFAVCDDDFTIKHVEECEEYKRIKFEFQSEPGYYVPCTILIPNDLEKPVPGVICLQGHSNGAHISLGIPKFPEDEEDIAGDRDTAVQATKQGYCAIALEQRYMGECGQRPDTGHPACIKDNAAMSSLLLGRTAIGERVWDVHRLIDVIEHYLSEYINPNKIICMGASGGGTATFYAACYDNRIALAMPACAVCTFDDSIMAMYHCPCNYIPNIRNYFDMGDMGCLIAPRPLIVVCGKDDPIFPLHGVKKSFDIIQKAYKKAGVEDKCHLVIGDCGHRFSASMAWPIVKRLIKE